MSITNMLDASTAQDSEQWTGIDTALDAHGVPIFGQALLITHPQSVRLKIAEGVDGVLKRWSNDANAGTVVRWISGSQHFKDQLMVGLMCRDVEQLWEFRTKLVKVVSLAPEAAIVPVTDWLEDYLADRQHAA